MGNLVMRDGLGAPLGITHFRMAGPAGRLLPLLRYSIDLRRVSAQHGAVANV